MGTALTNWLDVMVTRRAMIKSTADFEGPTSYARMLAGPKTLMNTFTLGLVPALARNFFMCAALSPQSFGAQNELFTGMFALGAVAISHPFEVARVLIVNNEGGSVRATLKALYNSEGVAGLYKGFIPRALMAVPMIVAYGQLINSRYSRVFTHNEFYAPKQPTAEEFAADKAS